MPRIPISVLWNFTANLRCVGLASGAFVTPRVLRDLQRVYKRKSVVFTKQL